MSEPAPLILYCHCQYAQVISPDAKQAVLRALCESGVEFEAVADLCEMAARKDPMLHTLSQAGAVKIAACFPRAVKGLFHQTGADLKPDATEILNMRTLTPQEVCARLLAKDLVPNVPMKGDMAPAPAATDTPETPKDP